MDKANNEVKYRIGAVRRAFSSREAFIKAIETKESATERLEHRNHWKNEDLDISPPEHWTWAWWDYAGFWWSYGSYFQTQIWSLGALTRWRIFARCMESGFITSHYWFDVLERSLCWYDSCMLWAIGVILHSRLASTYHFGFPVESRIPWGLKASYFPVLIRVVTCTICVGVSLIQGGYFVAVCLRCIFGHKFTDIPNHIPGSAGINIQQIIGLILIWFGTLPLLSVPIPKVRHIFVIKSFILPPITIGLFIYCILQG